MTAVYVALVQLEREAQQLSIFSRLIEQKLAALKVRDSVALSDLCAQDDALARSLKEARAAVLSVGVELNRLLVQQEQVAVQREDRNAEMDREDCNDDARYERELERRTVA